MVQVWNATEDEELADTPVTVHLDGVEKDGSRCHCAPPDARQ